MEECCKCREFDWPDPQEVVWTDPADGKRYCVFHAPKDEKWKTNQKDKYSLQDFNQHVFDRINNCLVKDNKSSADNICYFVGTIFPGPVWFKRRYKIDKPLPSIDFSEVVFSGRADFSKVHFSSETFFSSASFGSDAVFDGAVFCSKAWFTRTKFSGSAYFNATAFADAARFEAAKFKNNAWFLETTFQSVAHFDRSTFNQGALFRAAKVVGKMTLSDCQTRSQPIRIHSFSSQSLRNLTFTPSELSTFSFASCSWPNRLGLEVHANAEEKNTLDYEELYRAMKLRAAEKHDQPQVSHWHYREKLMALKRGGNGIFEAVMLWLYWVTSGFGERAVRAGVWLLALLGLSFLANAWIPDWSWNDVLPWADAANATLATIPFAKDIPGDGWVKAGRGFWQFLIAVQFTLFALAVRNRFRR